MEFKISDIIEKFRTLEMYKQPTDPKISKKAYELEELWAELVKDAKMKDQNLSSRKQEFAK